MKRFWVLLLILGKLSALPVGNPAEASLYKRGAFFDPCSVSPCSPLFMFVGGLDFRIGYYGDFSWNRQQGEYTFGERVGNVAKTNMQTNAAYPVINIYNWWDIFATFGVSTIEVDKNVKETISRGIAHLSAAFSWSVGTRATVYRNGIFSVGGMGQYFRTQPHVDNFFDFATGAQIFFNNTNPTAWEEWQVAGGATLDFSNEVGTGLLPYAAIKFNQGKFDLRNFQFTYNGIPHQFPDLEPVRYYGWAIGCTLLLEQMMSVTCEGRWLNETGIFINGQIRF